MVSIISDDDDHSHVCYRREKKKNHTTVFLRLMYAFDEFNVLKLCECTLKLCKNLFLIFRNDDNDDDDNKPSMLNISTRCWLWAILKLKLYTLLDKWMKYTWWLLIQQVFLKDILLSEPETGKSNMLRTHFYPRFT